MPPATSIEPVPPSAISVLTTFCKAIAKDREAVITRAAIDRNATEDTGDALSVITYLDDFFSMGWIDYGFDPDTGARKVDRFIVTDLGRAQMGAQLKTLLRRDEAYQKATAPAPAPAAEDKKGSQAGSGSSGGDGKPPKA